MEIVTKSEIAAVKDLMSKHNLTAKDLFSFCICAVNFLEYYYEESMYDMMYSCPERYAGADSNNRKAAAGALKGEQKAEGWTEVEQFAHYMESLQEAVSSEIENDGKLTYHFLGEMERFETVYHREVMVPFMLGCPVEDYDDEQFEDEDYIKSIANVDGLVLYKKHEEERDAWHKKCEEERAAELAKEVESKKNDKDFSVLLATSFNTTVAKNSFEVYNKTYYPDRDYKVIPLHNPQLMIVQTGGNSIEEVKDQVMRIVKRHVTLVTFGGDVNEYLRPVEEVFKGNVPKELQDNKVTHVVAYGL